MQKTKQEIHKKNLHYQMWCDQDMSEPGFRLDPLSDSVVECLKTRLRRETWCKINTKKCAENKL